MAAGLTAPLLVHGAHLTELLGSSLGRLRTETGAAFDLLDRLPHTGGDDLVQPLTEREVEILQHLPTVQRGRALELI